MNAADLILDWFYKSKSDNKEVIEFEPVAIGQVVQGGQPQPVHSNKCTVGFAH